MNKYYILKYIINNEESIYNDIQLAIFTIKELCDKEIEYLTSNSNIEKESLVISEISSEVNHIDNKIKLYCKFNCESLEDSIYLYEESKLIEKFNMDYDFYSSQNNVEVRYVDENEAEIWSDDFLMKLRILKLELNGNINY